MLLPYPTLFRLRRKRFMRQRERATRIGLTVMETEWCANR